MSEFDPYHIWLGIPETERPISKYRLLAIADFEDNRDVISSAAERHTVYLRTLQAGEHEVLVAALLNEVSQARVTLLNVDSKAAYDAELRKQQTREPPPTPVVVRQTVTTEFPVSIGEPAKKSYGKMQKEIWKQPAVIGLFVVGVIGVLVLLIRIMSSGDVDTVVRNAPPRGTSPVIPSLEPKAEPTFEPSFEPEPEPEAQPEVPPEPQEKPVEPIPTAPVFESFTNMLGMKLNKIPAGTFPMGSPEDEMRRGSDEQQHQVTISKAFYMQTTEVTQEQWMAVMGSEPWLGRQFTPEGSGYAASYVSWNDAVAYCEKLSEIEDKTYRLPTEAEWEYACRAGTETAWSFGDDEKALGDYAWYQESAINAGERYAHRVGRKKPNEFGLYDMHGNVWEWCSDYYRKDYYQQLPINYPQGPEAVSSHVLRGGSWPHDARTSRSAGRFASSAGSRNYDFGFRLVCELDDDAQLASGGNSDPSTMPVVDELDLLELATTMKNVREALEARDMDTAITELKKAQSLPQSPEYTAVVLRLAKMTELLNEFIKNSEDAINGFSPGSEIMCAGSTIVSVVQVSETKLVIRSGGQLKTYARNQLSIAIAMGIADTFFQNNKRTTSLKAAFVATHKMRSVSWITEAREWWESGPLPIETFNLYLIDRYNVQDASSKAEAPDNPLVRTIDLMESSPSYNLSVPYDGNVETSNITVQFDVTARGTEAFPSETVQTEPVAINKDINAKIMLGEHTQPSVGNSPARKFKLVGNVLVRLSYDAKKQEFRIYVKPTVDVGAGKMNSTQVGLSAPQSEKRIEELQRTILKTTQEIDIVHPANGQRLQQSYQQLEDQRANAVAANNLQLAANIATEMNNVGAQYKVQLNLMTSKRNRLPAFHFNLAYLKSLTLKLANLKYLDIRYRIFQKIEDKHVLIIDGW